MFIINRFTCSPSNLKTTINRLKNNNLLPIIDYVNENNSNIDKSINILKNSIINNKNNTFALKLSTINTNDFNTNISNISDICLLAIKNNSKLLIDAEDYLLQPQIEEITNYIMKKYNQDDTHIYKTYQMYRKDSIDTFLNDITKTRNYNIGFKVVRGAYMNQDKKYNIICDSYSETNENYNNAIELFCKLNKLNDKLLCATHNEESINIAVNKINKYNYSNKIEFAQLMGMSDNLSNKLSKQGYITYKYLPYGNLYESIPYLIRRLYENYPMLINIVK
jgi:hypothetical protein